MELSEYRQSIIDEIKFMSSADGTTNKEEFLEYITGILMEAEEIEDFTPLHYEGKGTRNRQIQIDGYIYNELDEYLSIFIVPNVSLLTFNTLTTTDAEKLFSKASAFIEDAEYILEKGEEATAGFGLAYDIVHKYRNIGKYRIYLLTDMVMSTKIKELKSGTLKGKPLEYHIWDINRLHQLDKSSSGKEEIVIDVTALSENGIPCLPASRTDDYTAYLCNIPGLLIANLYNTYGGRLLEGNVRSFLQTKGKVNKGIRNTILNDPTMFFAYNNGIAATASEIETKEVDGVRFITKITSLQIVNGGQTTASLAMSLLNDKSDNSEEKIANIYVPMKLSVVTHEKAQELIPNISRYANSQNKVSDADLWSNHPFHIRIEEFSRRIAAPATQGRQYGTHWYYERANGQYKQETYKNSVAEKKKFQLQNPPNQMFKKVDLSRYINIKQMRPDIASSGAQKGFIRFAGWVVKEWENDASVFNEDFYKELVSLAIIAKEADKIVRAQPWYNSYKSNIVAYTIAKIFYMVEHEHSDRAIAFKTIWAKQALSQAWISQIEDVSEHMYNILTDSTRPTENVTEWAKKDLCWDTAKKIKLLLNEDFTDELADKSVVQADRKYAKKDQARTNGAEAMIEVYNFGSAKWQALLEWDRSHNVLIHREIELITLASKMDTGILPTEKQAVSILDILDKAKSESFSI